MKIALNRSQIDKNFQLFTLLELVTPSPLSVKTNEVVLDSLDFMHPSFDQRDVSVEGQSGHELRALQLWICRE